MKKTLYRNGDLQILDRDDRYYIQYDVGSHQVIVRSDEICRKDALSLSSNPDKIGDFLYELKDDLIKKGIDPYQPNKL